jgi:hypothetical protein
VAGVVALPRLIDGDPARPSAGGAGVDCVAGTTAPTDAIGELEARWVRFCPLADAGSAQRVRHPQGVATGDLAAAVARSLWETQVDRPVCTAADQPTPRPTGLFRIEVGLSDGRVAEIAGDTGCSTRDLTIFGQLETTLLMDAAAGTGPPQPPPDPVDCPRRLTTGTTNRDGASADLLAETAVEPRQSTVPLLPMPATAADVCAYTGRGARRTLVDQWQVGSPTSEALRTAATLDLHRGARTDCAVDPARTSYVVVLTDATGTARTLAIDDAACGAFSAAVGTPPEDTWLGLATQRLVRRVARSRP